MLRFLNGKKAVGEVFKLNGHWRGVGCVTLCARDINAFSVASGPRRHAARPVPRALPGGGSLAITSKCGVSQLLRKGKTGLAHGLCDG